MAKEEAEMSVNRLNKTENTLRNIVFGLFGTGAGLLFPFIVRTVLIYRYGEDYLGLNGVFQSIITVLNLAELGFSSSVVFSLYKPIAENDVKTVNAYLAYFRKVYLTIGIVIAVAGTLLMPFLPLMIKDPTTPGNLNCYIWYLFFLSEAVISYVFYGYKFIIPTAVQRNDMISAVSMVTTTMKSVLQIIALYVGNHYFIFLAMSPLMTIVHHAILAAVVTKRFPQYKPEGMISKEQREEMRPLLAGILISKVRAVSRNSFDNICISTFIGLAAAGIYQNYFFIMTSISTVSGIITSSMLSGIGNSIVTDSIEKNYRDMRRFNFMFMIIAGWASICLLCLYQPFMDIWVGPTRMLGMAEVIAMSLYFYVLKLGDMRWTYTEGAGLWWKCRYLALAEAACNMILNVVLVRLFGVLGIISATLVSLIFIDNIFATRIVFDEYFKNGKLREYFGDQLKYFLVSTLIAVITYALCWLVPFAGIGGLIVRILICGLVPWPIYYLIYRRSALYLDAKEWMLEFISRKRREKAQ